MCVKCWTKLWVQFHSPSLLGSHRHSPVSFDDTDSMCRRGNKVFRKWPLGEGLKKTEGRDRDSSKMTQVSSWVGTLRAREAIIRILPCFWGQLDLHSKILSQINKAKLNQIIKPHKQQTQIVYLQRAGRKSQDRGGQIMAEQFGISHNCSGLLMVF